METKTPKFWKKQKINENNKIHTKIMNLKAAVSKGCGGCGWLNGVCV